MSFRKPAPFTQIVLLLIAFVSVVFAVGAAAFFRLF
jgi:hypothetical protein